MYGRQEDAAPTGYGVANDRLAHRGDKGWTQPRDDDRDPPPYDPKMDRYAVGTNVPQQRKSS